MGLAGLQISEHLFTLSRAHLGHAYEPSLHPCIRLGDDHGRVSVAQQSNFCGAETEQQHWKAKWQREQCLREVFLPGRPFHGIFLNAEVEAARPQCSSSMQRD